MVEMSLTNGFTFHTPMGYVRFEGRLVATYTTKGWVALPHTNEPTARQLEADKLVNRAITGISNKATAEEIVEAILKLVQADDDAANMMGYADDPHAD